MVRKAGKEDLETLADLAVLLWDGHTVDELIDEFADIISEGKSQFFLKYENDIPVGFVHCQLRYDYVEGTKTTPVGYLEGIFVREDYRKQGYARELLMECEAWAKENGCQEFASDCEIDNTNSFHFHKAMDFTEANRIICFSKKL
ncbi:aminoglycoside N(6')-acetyltransferase type 1 [Lachnospiraceae bacterium]|nr:aminoglycoside N(6')-acetyltransferase type 1 [Lachnospiraceae bacterium]